MPPFSPARDGAETVRLRVLCRLQRGPWQRADLEDAVQEAFASLYQHFGIDTRAPGMEPWLTVVAQHYLVDLCRRNAHESSPDGETSAGGQPGADELALGGIAVRAALSALCQPDRVVLFLRARGACGQEIATALGLGSDAAIKRLQRARERFKDALVRAGVDEGNLIGRTLPSFGARRGTAYGR